MPSNSDSQRQVAAGTSPKKAGLAFKPDPPIDLHCSQLDAIAYNGLVIARTYQFMRNTSE